MCCCVLPISRFTFQTATASRSRAAARVGLLVRLPKNEGRRSAERRIVTRRGLSPGSPGDSNTRQRLFGAPPRRLKTLVRSSGDVATLGDFAPHACPRPAALAAEPCSGPGRKPRASRACACEAQPQAPHPAGLGYPAPAKLSLCPTSGSPLEAPPHWTGREHDKADSGPGDRNPKIYW